MHLTFFSPFKKISTHTPLARRDSADRVHDAHFGDFYSHASCEARSLVREYRQGTGRFLLTRLLRGATTKRKNVLWCGRISTHTPLARRDFTSPVLFPVSAYFYSHASCEARHADAVDKMKVLFISTHTPLVRRDFCSILYLSTPLHFYSHASCEARRRDW